MNIKRCPALHALTLQVRDGGGCFVLWSHTLLIMVLTVRCVLFVRRERGKAIRVGATTPTVYKNAHTHTHMYTVGVGGVYA